jgi:nicotinate phosphoribosyltransferase
VAAAKRYGLEPVGTMAHSYVMSFEHEEGAFRAFMEDNPGNAVMLVDTYDTIEGVRHAIAAARATGVQLKGVRIDSGDLAPLSRAARALLDDAGMRDTQIVVSGDLEERQIARLVAAGAPIDVWGVGTDLGTSRDSPAVGGVYKLVADMPVPGRWRLAHKRSPAKATVPGPKQVWRRHDGDLMSGDVVGLADESLPGQPLLVPVMRNGAWLGAEALGSMRARALGELDSLPPALRDLDAGSDEAPYPVTYSERLEKLAAQSAGAQ